MVTYRTDRVNPLSAATLVVLALVSLLAIVPGQPAGAQSAGTDTVSSGNGDVPITRVVLNHGGVIDDQSASQSGVKDSSSTELLIESVTINDNGIVKVLDEFNFTGVQVRNQTWPTNLDGVRTSENGIHTEPDDTDFWTRVEHVLGSTDLRDYLDVSNTTPDITGAGYDHDFDFQFQYPVETTDYILVVERHGNSNFELEALDADGNVIAGSRKVNVDDPYGWNTGYAPSDVTSQPMHFTVIDVEAFGVNTNETLIAGFRLNNDNEADLKFFALSDTSFTPQCPTGFFQVLSGRLNRFDPTTGIYTPLDESTVGSYNAMAFREGEGVFYAISGNSSDGSRSSGDLIRVSVDDGSIVNLGVNILPGAYTADIDPATGYMHISRGGRDWTVFDLDNMVVVDTPTFTSGDGKGRPGLADIAIIDGRGYGMTGDRLGVYDLTTLEYFTHDIEGVTGVSGLTGGWGSSYVVGGDQLYSSNNPSGAIVYVNDFDTTTPRGTRIATGQPTGNNDGGSCRNAPDPFGVVDANDDIVDVYPGNVSPVTVMANDTAPAGSVPRIVTTNVEGTLEVRDDGVVLYTPTADELTKTRSFVYELCPGDFESGHARCDYATATLNVVCPPGRPLENRPPVTSGVWSQLDTTTWRTTMDDTTVSMTFTGAVSISTSSLDSMDTGDYSRRIEGNPSIEALHDFDGGTAQLVFTFSPPVNDPELHVARLGGYSGWEPLIYSHSSRITVGPDLTWTEAAGNGPHFVTTSDTIIRTTGTLLDDDKTSNVGDFNSGSSAGSLEIDGLVDRVELTFEGVGGAFAGAQDAVEFVFTEAPTIGCGGLAAVQASKSGSADLVAVNTEVEWTLGTVSSGTTGLENLVVTDVLPEGLTAVSLRSGSWQPTSQEAALEIRQNGNWITVATVDGNDDVTYNLPASTDAVRMRFTGELNQNFRTGVGARLTTRVENPPTTGGEPDDIVNCAEWSADNMATNEACDLIELEWNTAKPDLTLTNSSGSAPPGGNIVFDLRIENDPSAARPYREPFVAVLLPEELDFYSWQPMSPEEPPQFTLERDHEGTGRTLVRWDFRNAARDLSPGEVFDLVLTTTVRPATPPSSFDIDVVTGTNNTEFEVDCVDPVIADVHDVDRDGNLTETVCRDGATFDVDVIYDVDVIASTQGRLDRDFIVYDDVEGLGVDVDVAPLVTGQNTHLERIVDTTSSTDWTTSDTRTGTRSAAVLSDCGAPLAGDAAEMAGDCVQPGTRWFQRSFELGADARVDELVLRGDLVASGRVTVYVNGRQQGRWFDDQRDAILTGPWVQGTNLIEIEVDADTAVPMLSSDLSWFHVADADDGGRQQVNIAIAGSPTQDSTPTIWYTAEGAASADRAIDGDTNGNYWDGSVTHSREGNTDPKWWHVDLGTSVVIDAIEIWNRTDCCSNRLNEGRLFISDSPISGRLADDVAGEPGVTELVLPDDLSGQSITSGTGGATGRYVLFTLDNGQHLQLAEVRVLTHIAPAVGTKQLDSDWTVSDTLDGERRPAVSVARSCVPNWGPAPGQASYLWGENCERPVYDGGEQLGTAASPFVDISQAQDVPSGLYWFDLDGVAPFRAEVDNSNGGGWILVLNYVHQGGTNPDLDVRTSDLPISTNAALGTDESGTAAWGHAGNALFAALDADEVRFYAESSNSDSVMHFRTFTGVEYFETGTGSVDLDGLTTDFTALEGHDAALPASATNTHTDRGDEALTQFPFYNWGTEHWGIRGNGDRWEVDDFPAGPGADTIHRVWVRSSDPWQGTSDNTAVNTTYFFHREFDLDAGDLPSALEATARFLVDNSVAEIYVNDVPQGVGGSNWQDVVEVPLSGPFQVGPNTITMAVTNADGPAAFAASIDFQRSEFTCSDANGHTSRPCIAQTTSHGPGSLQIELKNEGNVATGGLTAYSILPFHGDVSPLTGDAVGSDYRATLTEEGVLDARPDNVAVTIAYSLSENPCRPELFGGAAGTASPAGCDNDWGAAPDDLSLVRAVRVQAEPDTGTFWNAGDDLRVRFPMQVAQGSWERDEDAFFPVAYVLDSALGTPGTPTETSHAGLRITQSENGVGEWVWMDANRNGMQDPGEEGLNGVEVELYDVDRNLVATTMSQNLNNDSARAGSYWFGDLEPGEYFIRLVRVPIAWNPMTPDIGFDDRDSDINPLTLEGPIVNVGLGGIILTQDIGFFVPAGPVECEDVREPLDPTNVDADRRSVSDASPCPS